MNTGMLWFDNDPKTTLTTKIERAVDYYRHKYGRDPNLCLIHPSMLPQDGTAPRPAGEVPAGEKDSPATGKTDLSEAKGVRVRPYRPVLPGHLWIGIEDKR
jgi:hypothetical protein